MAPLRKFLHEGVEQLRKRLGGDLSQTLGKILKDKGDFSKSAAGLRHYSDPIIISGPRNEGWATGDYAQVPMEMEQIDHVEEKFSALLKKRLTYFSPDEKNRNRKNNVIFVRRCLVRRMTLSASALSEAETMLSELTVKFQHFGDPWPSEGTRVFFVLTVLARTAQGTIEFPKSSGYWQEALHYAGLPESKAA